MKVQKIKFVTLFIFVIFILIETITFAGGKTARVDKHTQELLKTEATLSEEEQETLDLINAYRKQKGLAELKTFARLQEVARLKATDIVNNSYFSHNSENLGTPFEMLKNEKIDYVKAGENLAGSQNPQRAYTAWINSPSHKENILEADYQYTAICVIDSPVYGKMYVQLFIGV